MRINFFKLFLLITVLIMSSGDLLAQVNWTKYPGNPVITGGPSGSWYHQLFLPFVLYNADSSRYEMWFSASDKSSGSYLLRPWKIGFATSPDGITWTIYPTPVISPSPGQWDSQTVEEAIVLRENGQYKMWYAGGTTPTPQAIGYATSPDGINWTKHSSNPILTAGTDPWEAGGVCGPFLMPYESGYKVWYTGWNTAGTQESVGYATSVDGIVWQRDTQNNPVLSPGNPGSWDDTWLGYPRVLYKDNIYYMYFVGVDAIWGKMQIGLATSSNEVEWQKHQSNPVLQPSPGQWDEANVNPGSVLLIGDTLYFWYDGGGFNPTVSTYKIGLATSEYTSLPLPPGTYTIGTGGNFATIQDAFNKLSADGVAGNVTLELINDLYIAPTVQFGFSLNGPIPGAGPNSRVKIKPAENKNVTIQGNREAVLYLVNTSYVTFDGVSTTGSTTLTIHAQQNSSFVYNDALDFINNSDHNVIQNITFIVDDITKASGSGFWYNQTGPVAPDSNFIQNNFVKKGGISFFIVAPNPSVKGKGNIIRGNQIGSATDSLIAYGIQVSRCENTIIEDNILQNMKVTLIGTDEVQTGIISISGSADIIRNNVIGNLRSSSGYSSSGIFLSGDGANIGVGNQVYNNMVYNIQSTSAQNNSRVSGIEIWYQTNPKVYYNSVYLSGTGANQLGSAALYIYGNCTNVEAKNNIFVNVRDESPYCASAIYDYTAANLTSDYNDLYYDAKNSNNCLVRAGGTDYDSLETWQATGNDMHSYVEMPHFISADDLHVDGNFFTLLNGNATPLMGIETDIDGEPRNPTVPDIGADEFDIVGVEDELALPTEFALEQNYPNPFNPSTTLRYSIPTQSKVVIKVYDILGNEIATLMDEEKSVGTYELTWNAVNLPSGVYFYQLKAGEFIRTKKMILLK